MSYYNVVEKYFDLTLEPLEVKLGIYELVKSLIYDKHVPETFIMRCCRAGRFQELVNKKKWV
jgi:hypothetical protein